ncbi:MAG: DUF535 family protein [Succinivibrionaceae bacterium]|nr:DUF535 family protein [Succinivibrionaceae bacterium]
MTSGDTSWKQFAKRTSFPVWVVLGYARKRAKKGIIHDIGFIYKYFRYWKTYQKYLDLLVTPFCHGAAESDPTMLYKIFRPYELSSYTVKERFETLRNHYALLGQYLSNQQFDQLGTKEGIHIVDFPVSEAVPRQYRLVMKYDGTHRREGELTVEIVRDQEHEDGSASLERIFSIAMNIGAAQEKRVLKINSIQGCTPHLPEPLKEIAAATKAAYGLMPRYMMINIAFKIARLADATVVLGIRSASHIYANSHYSSRVTSEDFRYDYDGQWKEFGAEDFDENYVKLTQPQRTPLEEIPSKKRSQHRKRYAFMDEINASLTKIFHRLNQ